MASFCQALRYGREVRKTRPREKLKDRRDLGTGLRRKKMPVSHWYRHPCFWASLLGQIFFLLFSLSYTYLLSCILFLFALLYFVNYAPLSRALCKFSYSLLSPPPPPLFLPEFYVFISVTVFVAVAFFLGFPNHQPLLSSAFGKRLRFHRFLQFRFAVAFR